VVLLLEGDGTDGSTNIIDSSPTPKTITRFGDTKISTTQSKYGGSSIYFDGSGDYLSIPANSSTHLNLEDFTIECFGYFNNLLPQYLYGNYAGSNSGNTGTFSITANGTSTSGSSLTTIIF
jgi:hypothetical protein